MAGLIDDNFKEEVLTELSWIMNAIDEITARYKIETYETTLIKYRVQPEEEKAIDKFFVYNIKEIDNISDEKIQKEIGDNFFKMTNKHWSMPIEIVRKLIQLKKQELGI